MANVQYQYLESGELVTGTFVLSNSQDISAHFKNGKK